MRSSFPHLLAIFPPHQKSDHIIFGFYHIIISGMLIIHIPHWFNIFFLSINNTIMDIQIQFNSKLLQYDLERTT